MKTSFQLSLLSSMLFSTYHIYANEVVAISKDVSVIQKGLVNYVEIAHPIKGISHNEFKLFNISADGKVILINSGDNQVASTEGARNGNPNLKDGPARIIINEVTGGSRSILNGPLEVATSGNSETTVIILNPAGITCGGNCDFINISHAILATASSELTSEKFEDSNSLAEFKVEQGDIIIEGNGIGQTPREEDSVTLKTLSLITPQLTINGPITLDSAIDSTIALYLGKGSLSLLGSKNLTDPIQIKPLEYLISDFSSLLSEIKGQLSAKHIRLHATPKGIGVNFMDNLTAHKFSIDGEGNITFSGNINVDRLVINDQDPTQQSSIINEGKIEISEQLIGHAFSFINKSSGKISVNAFTINTPYFENAGTIDFVNLATLKAKDIVATGLLYSETGEITLDTKNSLESLEHFIAAKKVTFFKAPKTKEEMNVDMQEYLAKQEAIKVTAASLEQEKKAHQATTDLLIKVRTGQHGIYTYQQGFMVLKLNQPQSCVVDIGGPYCRPALGSPR